MSSFIVGNRVVSFHLQYQKVLDKFNVLPDGDNFVISVDVVAASVPEIFHFWKIMLKPPRHVESVGHWQEIRCSPLSY